MFKKESARIIKGRSHVESFMGLVKTSEVLQLAESPFNTTHWTVVLEAGHTDPTVAREAFASLYLQYWRPLYSFVRNRGYAPFEAEDITQDFFTSLLERGALDGFGREGGKFRSFLLKSLSNYLSNSWRRARTLKRGAGVKPLSLDIGEVERMLETESTCVEDPVRCFERRWVSALLDAVLLRLQGYYQSRGKADLFRAVQPYLQEGHPSNESYAQAAARLGMQEGAFKVAVHRMRGVYGQLLREEVARTVGSPAEIDAEIRYLIAIVSN
jgi:RNA polymerase sigma-70 factor (ECF subfamily)